MKITNNQSVFVNNNYSNKVVQSHQTSPSFKSKQVLVKNVSEQTLKLASLVATSVATAAIALRQKQDEAKELAKPIIQDVEPNNVPVETDIVTEPAQLSLFHMHDFHGQSARMERAQTAGEAFDKGELDTDDSALDAEKAVDRLKLCSGDMFLGSNPERIAIVNEFLNNIGVIANTVGNHECDSPTLDFAQLLSSKKYRLVGTNIHPETGNAMNEIVSNSFIVEVNGHKYGIIGATPVDIMEHTARPEQIEALKTDTIDLTIEEIQDDINTLKQNGVNKIILLSHLGVDFDRFIAQKVNDIDVILGGHTHTLFTDVVEGENLFYSPKGEPVLIVQSGRDGEYIGVPNMKFNELGQIIDIDYNVVATDDFERSKSTQEKFDKILGKAELLGSISKIDKTPRDIYALENPNCNFIMDCLRAETGADIAVMNAASIRNKFAEGEIMDRDLEDVLPFSDRTIVTQVTEKELVNAVQNIVTKTIQSPNHRPGIIQVSGINYSYDKNTGKLLSFNIVDKEGNVKEVDINNPSDKTYTVAGTHFCISSDDCGLGLQENADHPIKSYSCDIKEFVKNYLKKQTEPVEMVSEGRIRAV